MNAPAQQNRMASNGRQAPAGAKQGYVDPQADAEAQATAEQRRVDALQAYGSGLAQMRDKWIRARYTQGHDKRWIEDLEQYHSKDAASRAASQMMEAVEQGFPVTQKGAAPTRSTVFIGLTRMKTNAAEARLADILLPTDDRNWGIKPTPNPTMSRDLNNDDPAVHPQTGEPLPPDPKTGEPMRKKDIARAVMTLAKERSDAMQKEIEDQLIECDYNSEQRKCLHWAATIGTGVMKGPVVTNRTRRAWMPIDMGQGKTLHKIEFVEETSPASFALDPRRVYPDPACGDDIQRGQGIFEYDDLTPRQVRELADQPGYLRSQIAAVLLEGPRRSAALTEFTDEAMNRDLLGTTYQVWYFWGDVRNDALRLMNVSGLSDDDILKTTSACVVMINNTVVKAYRNPVDTGDLPYDFVQWEKVVGSPFGYGIPYLMRSQQRVLNAAWRQMMDNAGASSGPQIVMKRGSVEPADGNWQMTSRKIWLAKDTDDVQKSFFLFDIPNHQDSLANIIKMATDLADQETGMPMLAQGEKGGAPDTVGGMQMLMNAANVVLRRLVKQYDDSITRPHIRRYYDYNMMFNPKPEIKGDFSIDARGSSALLVRDIQNQAYTNLLAAAANPVYQPFIDAQKLFEKALQAQHIDPEDIMRPQEEIDKILEAMKSGKQADPRIEAAKITAESRMEVGKMQMEADKARTEREREALQLQRDIAVLKYASDQKLNLNAVKAQLAGIAIRERGQNAREAMKAQSAAAEMHLKVNPDNPSHEGI